VVFCSEWIFFHKQSFSRTFPDFVKFKDISRTRKITNSFFRTHRNPGLFSCSQMAKCHLIQSSQPLMHIDPLREDNCCSPKTTGSYNTTLTNSKQSRSLFNILSHSDSIMTSICCTSVCSSSAIWSSFSRFILSKQCTAERNKWAWNSQWTLT